MCVCIMYVCMYVFVVHCNPALSYLSFYATVLALVLLILIILLILMILLIQGVLLLRDQWCTFYEKL